MVVLKKAAEKSFPIPLKVAGKPSSAAFRAISGLYQTGEQFDSIQNNHHAADAVQPCKDSMIDFAADYMDQG